MNDPGVMLTTSSQGPFDGARTWVATSEAPGEGADERPVCLLLHGATVPGWQFVHLAPRLESMGFRCLSPDFFGHGDSDRPRGRYTLERFADQAVQVMASLAGDAPAVALGHSLGAAVLAETARRLPGRFSRLVLSAPMLDYMANSMSTRMLRVPGLGDWLMPLYVVPMLRRRRRRRYTPIGRADLADRFDRQVERPGFGPALLSMFRSGTLADQSARYEALGALGIPTLVMAGADDAVVTERQLARIAALTRAERRVSLPGVEHNMLMSHPDDCLAAMREFLLADTD